MLFLCNAHLVCSLNLKCNFVFVEDLKCIEIACAANSSFAVTDRGKVGTINCHYSTIACMFVTEGV